MGHDLIPYNQAYLPVLPTLMHPIIGAGIREDRLITNWGYRDAVHAIADYRQRHSPEKLIFERVYFLTPHTRNKKMVVLNYLLRYKPKKSAVVGTVMDDVDAIKILIGNSCAGCNLPGIRYALFEDQACKELIDIGRFDQWDLLQDITDKKLVQLSNKGMAPRGDWDYNRWLWRRNCSICGSTISINSYAFNIDSAICSVCGNRPYLSPSLHRMLEAIVSLEDKYLLDEFSLHALEWMSHVGANFNEVRRDTTDTHGARVRKLCWERSPISQVLGDNQHRVKALIEGNTDFSFDMYRNCARKVSEALNGDKPFDEERRIALEFLLKITRLAEAKQLSTR